MRPLIGGLAILVLLPILGAFQGEGNDSVLVQWVVIGAGLGLVIAVLLTRLGRVRLSPAKLFLGILVSGVVAGIIAAMTSFKIVSLGDFGSALGYSMGWSLVPAIALAGGCAGVHWAFFARRSTTESQT